jgi:hypothetical protein
VSKYGANYTAMFRDMRLNNLQHSAQHLETRCKRLANLLQSKGAEGGMEEEEGGAGGAGAAGGGGAGGGAGMEVERGAKGARRNSIKVLDTTFEDEADLAALAKTGLALKIRAKLR